ncbi:MAG: hypothetical protein H0T78_10530 [Longispora sp.]|nr:hypothetical protein [Longispora sp. (in: high G+C Gram-positive bacteria)]
MDIPSEVIPGPAVDDQDIKSQPGEPGTGRRRNDLRRGFIAQTLGVASDQPAP